MLPGLTKLLTNYKNAKTYVLELQPKEKDLKTDL